MLPFSCFISFGQLSLVYVLRSIKVTFPSGVKKAMASQLRPLTFSYQPEVLSRFAEVKQLLFPTQLALLKR